MSLPARLSAVCILPAALASLSGCGGMAAESEQNHPAYYIEGTKERREILEDLFTLLETETGPEEDRFSIVQEIANEFARQKEYGRLVNFLTAWTRTNPGDPYAAYYLLMAAYGYMSLESYPIAALYFDRVVKNYPDLIVRGESIHYIALNQLITLAHKPDQLVWYYEELITRFFDKIDPGMSCFMLAWAYEQTGDWAKALQTYTRFLPYYGTVIPGFPDAYTYAKQLVDFNNSPKDWTFESLSSLLQTIKGALEEGNSVRLGRYRAKVNFFARSWEQDAENTGMAEFNLLNFMRGNRIQYAANFDAGSNAEEVYLRTWGWSEIPIWYLYFRKIYFPPNPDIHGRWEWAGVYYGEKF